MSEPLNFAAVRNALETDPEMKGASPEALAVIYGLLDPLHEEIEKIIDHKLDLATFSAAKLAVVERAIETDFAANYLAVLPEGSLGFMSNADGAGLIHSMLEHLITVFHEMIHNTREWLVSLGIDERAALANSDIGGLNEQSLAAFDDSTLTIRGLLETQPACFIRQKM
jgi:hypothetical protein